MPTAKCAGSYHAAAYGDIVVREESGKMSIRFEHTPDLSATLSHWQGDTWKLEWQHPENLPWFSFGTVKFSSDNYGNVKGISFDVPNNDFWFEELDAEKQ